jgi:putative transcription antitermination factor YqgF
MILLGIDYGEKHIGLSIATGPLAEPLTTVKNCREVLEHITQICSRLGIEKIVIGISEGIMARKTKDFSFKVKETTKLPIVFQDETLTSQTVKRKLYEAKSKNKKKKGPDHAFAATEILQNYLDDRNM